MIYKIIYNTESKEYYFYTSDSVTSGWIVFDDSVSEQFYENLQKYQDWEEKAIKDGVTIQKELSNSQLIGDVRWKTEEGSHSGKNIKMNFIFHSQSKDRHQLVITTTTIESTVSGASFRLKPLYLEREQVDALIAGISPEEIEKTVNIYADFN